MCLISIIYIMHMNLYLMESIHFGNYICGYRVHHEIGTADCKLEADISAKLPQQYAEYRFDLMQQNQEFQASLLKRLFDKDGQ